MPPHSHSPLSTPPCVPTFPALPPPHFRGTPFSTPRLSRSSAPTFSDSPPPPRALYLLPSLAHSSLECIDGSENWGNLSHSDGEPVASGMELAPSTTDAPTTHMPPTSPVSTTAPLINALVGRGTPHNCHSPRSCSHGTSSSGTFSTSNDATSTPAGPSAKISRPDWEPAMVAGAQSRFGQYVRPRNSKALSKL
ncbi:hypothetical protein C8J57DRAFT_1565417 [Mycena rebaudengoi]|nr:hypothetical protein C8J57DRAFT_1565417 [Mycena rebaudengoi]